MNNIPKWLEWAREMQAIAQNGLSYVKDPFDEVRYKQLQQLAVNIIETHSDHPTEKIKQLFDEGEGYLTPKIDGRGVVFKDEKILLIQEREDGKWSLPGGWVDVGDSPSEAVVREIQEESGYRTKAVKLLALYDRDKHPHPPFMYHTYKLFFQCEIIGQGEAQTLETLDIGFFGLDELPELSISRILPQQIERFFEHKNHPDWPTDFD